MREFAPTYPRRHGRQTGPVVTRWPFRFVQQHQCAPATDTRFEFPRYPRAAQQRFTGPTALRRPHPRSGIEVMETNTRFIFPVYPSTRHLRRVGPIALRMVPAILGTARAPTGALPASELTTSVVDVYTMTTFIE